MNWIQKNMGMITMIAAVLSALVLTLPMLGVDLPSREGKQALGCVQMHNWAAGDTPTIGLQESACDNVFEGLKNSANWECKKSFSDGRITHGAYAGLKFESVFGADFQECYVPGQNTASDCREGGCTKWFFGVRED